ncbi:hypothetical protein VTO73DRAFT_3989 [Trametes versicolor]
MLARRTQWPMLNTVPETYNIDFTGAYKPARTANQHETFPGTRMHTADMFAAPYEQNIFRHLRGISWATTKNAASRTTLARIPPFSSAAVLRDFDNTHPVYHVQHGPNDAQYRLYTRIQARKGSKTRRELPCTRAHAAAMPSLRSEEKIFRHGRAISWVETKNASPRTGIARIAPFRSAYECFEFRPFRRLSSRTALSQLVEAVPLAPLALEASERK